MISLDITKQKVVSVTPVVDTAIYADKDYIGSAKGYELANALDVAGGQTWLTKIVIEDLAAQKSALDILFFTQKPTAGTDQAAYDMADADSPYFVGHVHIAATDYLGQLADNAVATKTLSPRMPFRGYKNRSLWVQFVSNGTPTYATASDLKFHFTFER